MAQIDNICIPIHLDAFALSPDCCDGPSRIAPYTQPNYTALRLDTHLIQHDVLDHTDFHNTYTATKNPRLADLGLPPPDNLKRNRMGIHLHWSLPRFYRAAVASSSTPSSKDKKKTQPTTPAPSTTPGPSTTPAPPPTPAPPVDSDVDKTNPKFPPVPNRWLVTRHLKGPLLPNGPKEYQSWIVESNVIRMITNITDDSVDLESDVAPFVDYDGDHTAKTVLKQQTEVFLGQKFDLVGYQQQPPRRHANLTLMNSSNPLFPDYALHNTNVFSIIDNFSYKTNPSDPNVEYLDQAHCDYFIIGWHDDPTDDPLNAAKAGNLSSLLKTMRMQLSAQGQSDFGGHVGQTRCLLFGAIYNVKFDVKQKPTQNLADIAAAKFFPPDPKESDEAKEKMEPLAVGTTPLDAILTFLEAHEAEGDAFFQKGGTKLATEVMEMSQFLYASADEYDARVQAQDLIAQQNFAKADGGLTWTFAKPPGPGGTPATPSEDEAKNLRDLNQAQAKLDVATRKLRSLRWELFAEWWKYASEYIPDKQLTQRQGEYIDNVKRIKLAIWGDDQNSGIRKLVHDLNGNVSDFKGKVAVKSAANEPYYTRSDPTLCIAGLDSGWPVDFVDPLNVTTNEELAADDGTAAEVFQTAPNPVPSQHGLNLTALKLMAEFRKNSNTDNGIPTTVNGVTNTSTKTTGFQAWGDQNPFAPLFIEWEAMYYHIDRNKWEVEVRPSPVGHAHSQVRYVPSETLANADNSNCKDYRIVSGRILVLPQPVFSLQNTVQQLILNQPPGLSGAISAADQANLYPNVQQLKFISATLSGLTSHLLTRVDGAHVKPLVRQQGGKVKPLDVAAAVSAPIGIDSETLKLVKDQSALTPYGSLMAFGKDQYPNPPFKGVTHGQMVFTQLNIIDKFGQAICLPTSQKPPLRHQTDALSAKIYPCLSDYLAPDAHSETGNLNTVFATAKPKDPTKWPLCEFIELTPAINQDARINASFLIRPKVGDPWREATEYEQPIWGWIIINYADGGLQFFLPDGKFYQEVRLGGVSATNISPKWLPYGAPPAIEQNDPATAQLAELIKQFSSGTYLQAFFDMINGSIQTMPFPPSDYSGYANAIVGKPLALVNVGWSIEMAEPAILPQNTLPMDDRPTPEQVQSDLESYSFPLKIGDLQRNFDGVVGYFRTKDDKNTNTTSTDPPPLRETDFGTLYSYFVPNPSDTMKEIVPSDFPSLNPYYLQPETTTDMIAARCAKATVTSLIIDPYTPLHGYSPILPTKTLTLPPWTIQTAFQNMHAFFRLGPNLLTKDVPLTYDAATAYAADPNTGVVQIPVSGTKGTWHWLQPYAQDDPTKDQRYVEINVQDDLGQTKFQPAPYTFLEGYLQLMGSLKDPSK